MGISKRKVSEESRMKLVACSSIMAMAVALAACAPTPVQLGTSPQAPVAAIPQFGLGGVGVGIAVFDEAGRMQRPSFWARFAPRVGGPEDHSIMLDGTIAGFGGLGYTLAAEAVVSLLG